MLKLLLIALGGAAGTLARFGTSLALHPFATRVGFPVGTLTVNLIGCLVIGLLGGALVQRPGALRGDLQLMLTVGFLGGYTTFSSFALETADLLIAGRPARAAAYVVVSNVAGVLVALAGFAAARRLVAA
jgi:CrcB protein